MLTIEITVWGAAASGKSELCKAMRRAGPLNITGVSDTNCQFQERHIPTIQSQNYAAKMRLSDTQYSFQMTELASKEGRFSLSDRHRYFEEAPFVFLCCDVTKQEGIAKLGDYYNEIISSRPQKNKKNLKIYIVGTKGDG